MNFLQKHRWVRQSRFWLGLGYSIVLGLTTQSKAQERQGGLDVNDVSVLFPLDVHFRPYPEIKLNSNLVTNEVFQQLLDYGKSEVAEVAPPEEVKSIDSLADWYVVGFRYDPCAPDDANPGSGKCFRELRLVAQPMAPLGPADSALHLIYTLEESQGQALHELLTLKQKATAILGTAETTSGKPLGVHPLLRASYSNSKPEVAELYKNYVLKYATADHLSQFTMMGLRNGSFIDWVFFGGHLKQHQWSADPIPNTPPTDFPFVEFSRFPGLGPSPHQLFPEPIKSELSTAYLLDNKTNKIQVELVPDISRSVHSLENPKMTNRNTVDCVSCHAATSFRVHPDIGLSDYVPGVTPSIPKGITAFVDSRAVQFSAATWNFRSFGYFTQVPSVSMRTVHESASAAVEVNTALGLAAPGPDCSRVQQQVSLCFTRDPEPFQASDRTEECLKTCGR